eukprot:m.199850 g.199850  ORF g.199850 m.199850 type:complete len:74 (+) comp25927_c3_seq2:145-366(+)
MRNTNNPTNPSILAMPPQLQLQYQLKICISLLQPSSNKNNNNRTVLETKPNNSRNFPRTVLGLSQPDLKPHIT